MEMYMSTERQNEIIQTTISLIYEKGIQGFTIRNLSQRIGISEPAIYRHFESKFHILSEILNRFMESSKMIFEQQKQMNTSSLDKIESLFKHQFHTFTEMPSLTAIIFSEESFRNEIVLTEKIEEVINYNQEILASIIRQGQFNGEIRSDVEPRNLSIMIMGTLRLFIKRWQFNHFSGNLTFEGLQIIEMIKILIRPPS